VATSAPAGAGRSTLPHDLLEDAAHRLRALCLVVVGLVALNQVASLTFRAQILPAALGLALTAAVVLGSAAVYLLTRRLRPERVIDLGLVYAVGLAFLLSAASVRANWFGDPVPGLAWSPVAVWTLLFPLMIPSTIPRTLVAALLAAGSEPLMALQLSWRGIGELPPVTDMLTRLWPNGVAVLCAIAITRVLHRLGQKLTAARAVGNYHLVTRLGEGGMGEVWQASHRLLHRPAAVKLISASAMDATPEVAARVFRRFEREAQATAQLQSPHTVHVYDFGVTREGTFYYVMEILDGLDLHHLVEQDGPQPPERVVHILRQTCHSLDEAHTRGLIHRDIKPANIYLCRYGLDVDFVKLLDFGLVKPREDAAAAAPEGGRLTQQMALTGTPGFIAPEAMLSDSPIDGRADLYSLGCVAYWLLTGREVFEHTATMALLMAHANQPPATPSARGVDVPPALEAIVMTLLAKDPAQRPQTARDLADRLAGLGIEERWTAARRNAWWAGRPPRTTAPDQRSQAATVELAPARSNG
jgi:eukaryotic-like serine/threonine-protein kinase